MSLPDPWAVLSLEGSCHIRVITMTLLMAETTRPMAVSSGHVLLVKCLNTSKLVC